MAFASVNNLSRSVYVTNTRPTPPRGLQAEKVRSDGLVELHAYSLLSVRQVPAAPAPSGEHGSSDGGPLRLVELRNPWGTAAEWNGAFSDASDAWRVHPAAAVACGYTGGKNDGKFWMPFSDFAAIFNTIQVWILRVHSALSLPLSPAQHSPHAFCPSACRVWL